MSTSKHGADDEASAALLQAAQIAKAKAYAPYSGFAVGAAVMLDNGKIVSGANVENASYGLSCCAERVAIFSAVTLEPTARPVALAVSTSAGDDAPNGMKMPCGACRQVIAEFMVPAASVHVDGVGVFSVAELLPAAFAID